MYYDEEYENYYDPTPADEIFAEAMSKLKEALKESVKTNIEYIQEENKRLKEENKSLRNKSYEVDNKKRQLEQKEKDLERTFYKSKFSELLKPLEENMVVWYSDYEYKKIKKCKLCDDNRKIIFVLPQGKTIKQKCECDKDYRYYKPKKTTMSVIAMGKSYDYSNSKFVATPKYHNNRDDDGRWCEFKMNEIIQTFNIDEIDNYDTYNTGFESKEECKKYCDYLNNKEKNKDDKIPVPKSYDGFEE